jgi:hypothetical protein
MSRKFKTANYEETLKQTIRLAEALPRNTWSALLSISLPSWI